MRIINNSPRGTFLKKTSYVILVIYYQEFLFSISLFLTYKTWQYLLTSLKPCVREINKSLRIFFFVGLIHYLVIIKMLNPKFQSKLAPMYSSSFSIKLFLIGNRHLDCICQPMQPEPSTETRAAGKRLARSSSAHAQARRYLVDSSKTQMCQER